MSSTTLHPLQRLSTFNSPTATSPTSSSSSILTTFATDPIFSSFLSADFNSTTFSSSALSSGSAASRIEKLQDGLRLLDTHLRNLVLSNHHHLLSQLTTLSLSDHSLSALRASVSSLQASLRRVRAEISDPHKAISAKTHQLNTLHETTLLIQSTIRALRLVNKLRDLMGLFGLPSFDLSKAAQLHYEILNLYNEDNLCGIEVLDNEVKWVVEVGERLRSEGMKVLESGLEGLNQAEVGAGLQVFYNMGELRVTVDGLVGKYKGLGSKSVSAALDMKAISASSGGVGGGYGGPGGVRGSGVPQIGGGAKAKEALWQRMSGCMDQVHSIMVAVWHLQRVLSKKRDPFTHVLLLDEVMQVSDPFIILLLS